MNWEKKSAVEVELGSVLKNGDRYRLMKPRELWGKAVAEGVYDGKPVPVPVEGEFAAFVLVRNAPPNER